MSYKNRRKISLSEARRLVERRLGILSMTTHTEGTNKLILFLGKRRGHRATYNKTTGEFWYV